MTSTPPQPSIRKGLECIASACKALPDTPGVYRMLGEDGTVLYVGKAKALKNRVSSYTRFDGLPGRIQRMVSLTRSMEFIHTDTEIEALLLEANLIKKLKPRFNILLRDDKSFPYILMTQDHDFPLIKKHRGAQKQKGRYYGPFANTAAVNQTITTLQRIFLLRNCPDTVFKNRTRPCLQYHIKRCTAPCVQYVTKKEYDNQVKQAEQFLEGKTREIQNGFSMAMDEASARQDYETAALYRDRIKALSTIQARQDINFQGIHDADVIALVQEAGKSCIQVFFFRAGQNYGNRSYFPRHVPEEKAETIMENFIAQFYTKKPCPGNILVNLLPENRSILQDALSFQAQKKILINLPIKGERKKLINFAENNAKESLKLEIVQQMQDDRLRGNVASLFDLNDSPKRIEVYDNSHMAGTQMVGAMIVATPDGFEKSSYRRFNIKTAESGDDYGMIREVLRRRFKASLNAKENPEVDSEWPDLILIDGGKGQLSAAKEVMDQIPLTDSIKMVAIAKGKERNAGRETFFIEGKEPFQLPPGDSVLHYLQRLRDEAHRFAIGTHRKRRRIESQQSPLDSIPGVGAKRKKALLHYFGSGKAVRNAKIEDLSKVEGISKELATKIHDYFR